MVYFVVCAFVIVFISVVIWCFLEKWKLRFVDKIPGPKAYPIIGNAMEFGDNPVDSLNCIMRVMKTYGPISRIWIGPNKPYILVTDPELLELFLGSQKYLKKSVDYKLFSPWLRNGLLLSTGSYWQKRRKIITPTFHFKILEQFVPVFAKQTDILKKRLTDKIEEITCFDIYPYLTAYTLDVICETAMGTTVNAQKDPNNNYCKAVKNMCNIFIERTFSFWKQFDCLFKFSSDYNVQKKSLEIIHNFTRHIIEERRKQLTAESSKEIETHDDEIGYKKRVAFLDLLLQSTCNGKPLTDEDISEEVDTFMFEGHDTTASALSFALYSISRNPQVQNKIIDELQNIFSEDKFREWTINDLKNMKYVECVIKETLRLYPSVPYYGRILEEDIHYKDMILPKGAMMSAVPISLHRRPELYKEPEKFDPERFSSENAKVRHPYAYIPFSAGPRNCIGQKFAMYEMISTVAKIVQNFELLPSESHNLILAGEAILKPANGVFIKLKKRF